MIVEHCWTIVARL